MASFRYSAIRDSGERVTGTIEGADRSLAISRLSEQGLHPIDIQEEGQQGGSASFMSLTGGRIPRAELSRVYAEHDVLVFPSEWDEPFAITPLEAIHCGLNVVGTTTGGSGELFRNRETAMTFKAGDAADCARAIRELCADRELFEKISFNARQICLFGRAS